MTKEQGKAGKLDVKALLTADPNFVREIVRAALQEVLEAEMTETVGAAKGERSPGGSATGRAIAAGP
jgi:putative transposase